MSTDLRPLLFSLVTLFVSTAVIAASDLQGADDAMVSAAASPEIQALRKEVNALKAEVEKLRKSVASLQAMKPTFTSFMPDFAERFHVMHRAGDAGDWAVKGHRGLAQRHTGNRRQVVGVGAAFTGG